MNSKVSKRRDALMNALKKVYEQSVVWVTKMHYLLTVDYSDFEKATLFFWKQSALHVTYIFCVLLFSFFSQE